ncbi:efflux RND transporter permease subunit [Corallococcus carmarthensis]|uniref:Efflux RND transporter permease subunit n=1 Tax=Corallococcus carmarthensis TaxID=2316728 RepID=A0A3A8KHF6_9BACT|nr:efflux RND transporter permease subunit [Corallococcus carmarthensis]RKH01334.1 efflux RND transporter permease subunit [Corallococcus carmarthensis]
MNRLIRWSIDNRLLVVAASVLLLVLGFQVARSMPVDVFPDLTAPTVTVLTEAHGLAPEEVETLVTFPIETAVNGATGVRRVRSASGVGISIVWVEFEWGTDIYTARQVVNEKLQLVAAQLPADVPPPSMAPISSVMGEILFLSVSWKPEALAKDAAGREAQLMEARGAADWVLRKRLLSVPGVSQVVPIGGSVKQYQVLLRPESLQALGVSFEQVAHALRTTNQNASGGFYVQGGQEYLLRAVGRARGVADLAGTVVKVRGGVPITVGQVADVQVGPRIKRGEGSANAEPAVILAVMKQPDANTLALTERLDAVLDEVQATLPQGMVVGRNIFRQSDFISVAVRNVSVALRDGALLVAVILLVFLMNARATFISLTAIPLSLVATVLALKALGVTLNTMTIGGLTIAIGALVDDAIIDVENVFRRLRENAHLPEDQRQPMLEVIYRASIEVRHSIVFATLIIILVFLPLFFLSGLEGRMLAPLGLAYIVAIAASLVVAMTLTPALCAYLLPKAKALGAEEGPVLRWLKTRYRPVLLWALARPRAILAGAGLALVATFAVVPFLGRAFLPEFNEGTLTLNVVTLPGTSLQESDRLGRRVEQVLLSFPEVVSTSRRTGRAELDEHAQDVNAAEVDVGLDLSRGERSKEQLLEALRKALAQVPGAIITIGQPLSHRIDHMLSGTRANIALKLYGDDLDRLRTLAEQVKKVAEATPGAVDVAIEQQVDIPQIGIRADRDAVARYGLTSGEVAEAVERAFAGETVGTVLEGQLVVDIAVRLDDASREDLDAIAATPIDTPTGHRIPLKMLASLTRETGPNTISREGVQRKMVVQANVAGRDLSTVVEELRARIPREVPMPTGYYVDYGGQFESAEAATRTIGWLSVGVVVGVFLLLVVAFGSVRNALLTLINLPLALIGGVLAVALTSGVVSVASLVGFITLFGIATRNGILMVSHYEHLMTEERKGLAEAVVQGSLERLAPVLMTALCAGLALVPLVLAGGEAGNEIQAPMGVVILGGLLSSTFLNMLVVPVLFRRFGRPPESRAAAVPAEG